LDVAIEVNERLADYDFSKMTDTKGGFLTQEDDPFNKQLHVPDGKEVQSNGRFEEDASRILAG
jgi:hypothetical protein